MYATRKRPSEPKPSLVKAPCNAVKAIDLALSAKQLRSAVATWVNEGGAGGDAK